MPARHEETLELDELWSFVGRRKRKRWVWLALCRRTRQVVAYAIGGRGERTCRLLWERVPAAYKGGLLFTDFWDAYQKVLPEGQHRATGKGAGQTSHIERFNNVLQQRPAPAPGAFRPADALVLEDRHDARQLPAPVPA